MLFRALADAVLLAHLAFVLFVAAGALLALRWRWMPWLHLPALAWGVWIEFSGRICPLTPLENWLRRAGGKSGYPGGFVEHYVLPVLYPAGLTRDLQWTLGAALVLLNLLAYGWVLWHWRHRPRAG